MLDGRGAVWQRAANNATAAMCVPASHTWHTSSIPTKANAMPPAEVTAPLNPNGRKLPDVQLERSVSMAPMMITCESLVWLWGGYVVMVGCGGDCGRCDVGAAQPPQLKVFGHI